MSGRVILGAVGAVIGFYFGGPAGAQAGWMIGYGVGTLIDPQQLQGATYQGRSVQGAADGQPRAIVLGSATVTGSLMDSEPAPRVTRAETDAGKGGPEVVNDTALLTFAIEICDSSELRGTKVEKITAVWEDEKLVYDIRPDAKLPAADSAKWIANKRFYYGGEDQQPDPALSAIHGAGNTPAYCGTCYMVAENEDLIPHGERLPIYRFLVSKCSAGTEFVPPNYILVTGGERSSGAGTFAVAQADNPISFARLDPDSGANLVGGIPAYDPLEKRWAVVSGDDAVSSIDNRLTWQPTDFGGGAHAFGAGVAALITANREWLVRDNNRLENTPQIAADFDGGFAYEWLPNSAMPSPPAAVGETTINHNFGHRHWHTGGRAYISTWSMLFRSENPATGAWPTIVFVGTATPSDHPNRPISMWIDSVDMGDGIHYAVVLANGDDTGNIQIRKSTDDGYTWGEVLLDLDTYQPHPPAQLIEIEDEVVAFCEGGGVRRLSDGWTWIDTGLTGRTALYNLSLFTQARQIAKANRMLFVIGADATVPHDNDGNFCVVSTDKGATWSAPIDMGIADAVGIVGSDDIPIYTGLAIPDSPGYYVDTTTGELVGPPVSVETECDASLADIEETLYALAGLEAPEIDVAALEDIRVKGYAVQGFVSVTDAIGPLRQFYFHDCPEYDKAIHAVLRGGDVVMEIDPDDVIQGESSNETGTRGQPVEFPRKLNLRYISPTLDYKPTTQVAERWSPDVRAKGEETVDAMLVAEDDEAAKATHKALKVIWNEREDSREIAVPIDYVSLVPSDRVGYMGRHYRIDAWKLIDGGISLKLAYDRKSAYSSNAVAITPTPRPDVPSGLFGPTHSAVMNLPVLRDADDKAGIYWAVAGQMPNWRGARLQLSRDGGSTWEDGPQITAACTMGTLTADLPSASRYAQDWVNTLSVRLHPGAVDLDSVTHDAIIAEANVAAILYPDGTAEVVQFEGAVETTEREYTLTGLMRGRQDTVAGEHLAGAQFVLLDEKVRFVAIRPDDVGRTLTFRAVTLGTDASLNASQSITMTTIESLREWQPYNVRVHASDYDMTTGSSGYCVEWIGRARLGSSRTPVHSQWFAGYRVSFTANGKTYSVETTEQAICVPYASLAAVVGPTFAMPAITVRAISRVATGYDDFDSAPADPVTPTPPATSPGGGPASTGLGPNGGYPDSAPYPVPEPTTFGGDVIDGGDFADAGDITAWRNGDGSPLDARWSIVDGRLCYYGIGTASAYYWPARRTLAQQLIPHYSFAVDADVQSEPGARASVGVGRGWSTYGESLSASAELDPYGEQMMATPQEYAAATSITHSFTDKRNAYGVGGGGQIVIQIVAPAVLAQVDGLVPRRVYFDNVAMEITENAPATTPATIAHLNFDAGLTGWVQSPPASAESPSPTVSGGEVTFTPTSEYGIHKYLVNTDPITDLDTLDKWVRIGAEINCNDPTTVAGVTQHGVSLGYAISIDGGTTFSFWTNPCERGDWTERERWMRNILDSPGTTYHVCLLFMCAVGYRAKVRNIGVEVTDAPVT